MSISHRRFAPLGRSLAAIATFAALAAAPALTACSDSESAPSAPAQVIAGTYALEQVNGQPLPFVDGNEYWDSMTITLGGDLSLRGTIGWRETDDAGAIVDQGMESFAGSYTASGNRLTLTIEDDEPVTAMIAGDLLTITADGNVMVLRRR